MKNVGNSTRGRSQGVQKIQGTPIYSASRGHLCDSTVILLFWICNLPCSELQLCVYETLLVWFPSRRTMARLHLPLRLHSDVQYCGKPVLQPASKHNYNYECQTVTQLNMSFRQLATTGSDTHTRFYQLRLIGLQKPVFPDSTFFCSPLRTFCYIYYGIMKPFSFTSLPFLKLGLYELICQVLWNFIRRTVSCRQPDWKLCIHTRTGAHSGLVTVYSGAENAETQSGNNGIYCITVRPCRYLHLHFAFQSPAYCQFLRRAWRTIGFTWC